MKGKIDRGRNLIAGLLSVMLAAGSVGSLPETVVWAGGVPGNRTPSTSYAAQFIADCEGQEWFLEEVERLLHSEQKTVDHITGREAFSHITSLGLSGKGIRGKIPKAIGELSELRYLFLADNQLTGEIPAELFTLDKLANVDLSNNAYGGAIPGEFGGMPALRQLLLSGNGFEGGIPSGILRNGRIRVLDLSQNRLTGGIPAELNQMTGLEYLGLSQNALGGSLPDLSSLSDLKVLSAWSCVLTGELPATLYQNTKLEILDLAGNSLTGSLSGETGNWERMRLLALGSNRMNGPLPDSMKQLTKLEQLDLSDNFFEGRIPDAFSSMSALTTVRLSDNRLRGRIPASLAERTAAGTELFVENNYLTGDQLLKASANQKNFCDEAASEQYQVVLHNMAVPMRFTTGQSVNLYPYLKNRNLRTGSLMGKPALLATDYELKVRTGDPSKVSIEVSDTAGIRFQVLSSIDYGEGYVLELCIRGNEGSSRSTAAFQIVTGEIPPSAWIGGGGGGGGGVVREGTAESTGEAIAAGGETEYHTSFVSGYPDGRFHPDQGVSREETAVMLYRILTGEGEVSDESSAYAPYLDVKAGRWSAAATRYASKSGLLSGYPDGTFQPAKLMTRAEFVSCLVRLAEETGMGMPPAEPSVEGMTEAEIVSGGGIAGEATPDFIDVKPGAWYAEAVFQTNRRGLLKGYPDGSFRPQEPITRAEASAVLNRLLERDAASCPAVDGGTPYVDVPEKHWAYRDILEASMDHEHAQNRSGGMEKERGNQAKERGNPAKESGNGTGGAKK